MPLSGEALGWPRLTTAGSNAMGGSILVVEDEAAIRDLLAANLQRAGYRVMTAGDVPQAEALVRESRPDLVLLDWVLPGIPGLTFARRLRGGWSRAPGCATRCGASTCSSRSARWMSTSAGCARRLPRPGMTS